VSLTASFRGSKVRKKIIRENLQKFSKCNKVQKITKLPQKKVLSHDNRMKNALFTADNVILRFFFAYDQNFSKIHKTDKKIFLA
jgi:hypothetical protein